MTIDPADFTATGALREIAAHRLSAAAIREACVARVTAREPQLQALAAFDPAAVRHAPTRHGPLGDLPLGVKDVLDTSDLPTEYNSPIWRGHRPVADAACVAWAREAGAVVFGKTVTTEFATRFPGPTTNPHDPACTPGGSSSGSAAGVAAGYFPFAFGTQTAGSVIRPAAYCGVVGYKPTFGTINRFGMKLMSESLDTVGVFARSVADCALLTTAVSGLAVGDVDAEPERALRVGVCRSPMWDRRAPETEGVMETAIAAVKRSGAALLDLELPAMFEPLEAAHTVVMNAESARALGWEMTVHRDQLSPPLRERMEWGLARSAAELEDSRIVMRELQLAFDALMADVDVLITPSAAGAAPRGLEWTGDPAFNLLWTALHVPCVTIPCGVGPGAMPLGIQLVAARNRDALCLRAASWLSRQLDR
ncbi:MAG: amidase [Acetobacteraceae bacterium]|nr:amidase [Acetobacteraceae bacterium]